MPAPWSSCVCPHAAEPSGTRQRCPRHLPVSAAKSSRYSSLGPRHDSSGPRGRATGHTKRHCRMFHSLDAPWCVASGPLSDRNCDTAASRGSMA
ncbi:Piso0_000394 [Millerozyma farinosa CBS 7064]|uniref:Piso0_000394 protein n=1 Tax=Pichia sorbitophila (strain ATCC MYA-4447 / BCRC 22081 / CBS 7064 / NBRC 10061 / NRRL Y-12695) TaxID=559304 RepID=G8YVB7_PICSO|nr:Piso0_000394 [Millerozyma farinosa CBS 7064]CCE73361.1 Piso0_000394 [Millerozyma farinosa CBS 7064]